MWNAMHNKSLAGAVLISVVIQGSLLWRFNQLATEGASSQTRAPAASALVSAQAATPALREVTLAPVVIVGRRAATPNEPERTLASVQQQDPETRSARAQQDIHM